MYWLKEDIFPKVIQEHFLTCYNHHFFLLRKVNIVHGILRYGLLLYFYLSHENRKSKCPKTDFILLGFFQYGPIDTVLFAVIAILFSVALMGNIILILLIQLDTRLHTPMYFLLSQLSFIDMMYIFKHLCSWSLVELKLFFLVSCLMIAM